MKKLIVIAVVVGAVVGVSRWREPADAPKKDLVYNRIWIDHLPTSERDPFLLFGAFKRYAQGGFAVETRWHGEVERFRFEAEGEELRAVFPWKGDREQIRVRAWRCDENDMDFCLELTGSKRGTQKYYSRNGWERGSIEDVETFRTTLFE